MRTEKDITSNMKRFSKFIKESRGWNPSFDTHKKAYNEVVKLYNKYTQFMSDAELKDMFETVIDDIDSHSMGTIK